MILSSIMLAIMIFLTACGEEEAVPCGNTLVPIEVSFSWDSVELDSGAEVEFEAIVTHDEIPVDNAQEVIFEIWEHGNEDYHFMEETVVEGDGRYTLDWTFDRDGVYYVYYHVTACSMHRMEKVQIVIGDVDVDAILAEPDIGSKWSNSHEHGHGEGDDEHEEHEDGHEEDHSSHEHDEHDAE